MRGSMFWVHLDTIEKLGAVLFKLYGQACNKCGTDDETTLYPDVVSGSGRQGTGMLVFKCLLRQ